MRKRIEVMAIFRYFCVSLTLASAIVYILNCPRVRTSHPPEFSHRTIKREKNFNKHFEVDPLYCRTNTTEVPYNRTEIKT